MPITTCYATICSLTYLYGNSYARLAHTTRHTPAYAGHCAAWRAAARPRQRAACAPTGGHRTRTQRVRSGCARHWASPACAYRRNGASDNMFKQMFAKALHAREEGRRFRTSDTCLRSNSALISFSTRYNRTDILPRSFFLPNIPNLLDACAAHYRLPPHIRICSFVRFCRRHRTAPAPLLTTFLVWHTRRRNASNRAKTVGGR